ncbi:MFS transporter [Sutcliffiella horikoshii]|uniref:MFS transporter n=1 Tax=Sutcliffiella horikoshii TaxID=79883 RepID=A0A1Y0CUG4_9BACI|nr:MFS transporter [Sutcliffiella horikoshii]ART78515.1 MFS transporter [Sutcliffiella horikoshii]TYS58759.1 MFS transporter [Sutcliffiella horikoshii]
MASIPLIMTLGNSMLIPVLPMLEKELDISSFQSSMIITSYSVASIFLIPIAGYLSDRFGRKMIILPSLILALIGGLISGFASWKIDDPYTWIIIGRIIQGVGAAGATPIILPLVGDLYQDDDEKTSSCLGIIETSNTFGKVLSPILGSLLAAVLWYLPFFSISIFSLISILMVLVFIKVPKKKDKPLALNIFIQNTKKIFQKEGKWLYTTFVIGIYAMLILFGLLFYLSDILEKTHDLHGVKKGLYLAVPLFTLCVSSYITGKVIKGNIELMRKILLVSLGVIALTIVFVEYQNEKIFLLLTISSFIGISIGAMLPTLDALITENVEKEEKGTISSLYSSSRFIGVAAGPPIMSVVMKNHLLISLYLSSALAIIIGILVFIFVQNVKPKKSTLW